MTPWKSQPHTFYLAFEWDVYLKKQLLSVLSQVSHKKTIYTIKRQKSVQKCVFEIQQRSGLNIRDDSNPWGCWGPRRSLWPRLAESAGRPAEMHTEQPQYERHPLECSGPPLDRRTRDFQRTSAEDRWAVEEKQWKSPCQLKYHTYYFVRLQPKDYSVNFKWWLISPWFIISLITFLLSYRMKIKEIDDWKKECIKMNVYSIIMR